MHVNMSDFVQGTNDSLFGQITLLTTEALFQEIQVLDVWRPFLDQNSTQIWNFHKFGRDFLMVGSRKILRL